MRPVIAELTPEYDQARVADRPDGFYWREKGGTRESGPFPTLLEAVQDMQAAEGAPEPGETLQEAQAEIGIAEWLDPETGDPAEEERPRIKDQ